MEAGESGNDEKRLIFFLRLSLLFEEKREKPTPFYEFHFLEVGQNLSQPVRYSLSEKRKACLFGAGCKRCAALLQL